MQTRVQACVQTRVTSMRAELGEAVLQTASKQRYSYGLYRYDVYSYGLCIYGLCNYGLYSYGQLIEAVLRKCKQAWECAREHEVRACCMCSKVCAANEAVDIKQINRKSRCRGSPKAYVRHMHGRTRTHARTHARTHIRAPAEVSPRGAARATRAAATYRS